jgi:hypothetical protein
MSTDRIIRDACEQLRESRFERRQLLKSMVVGGLAAVGGSTLAAGAAALSGKKRSAISDADVLNFALNLEYLEAEYYLRATTGMGLAMQDRGIMLSPVIGGAKVPFQTKAFEEYGREIAADELAHVRFLRKALGSLAVNEPAIDLKNSFNKAAQAAGLGNTFDPFANEVNFMIGAFVFEDVGVTAYKGGATLLQDANVLEAAAGILGVEAYHAGVVRSVLYTLGGAAAQAAQAISDLRDAVDGADDRDQGLYDADGKANIVPTDEDGIAYSRNTDQVLKIVYLGGTNRGGFFPHGLNGTIR